jgi:hypothetical protein
MRGPVSGSFEVDSSFIGMSGNTDISGIIANLSFTGEGFTFNLLLNLSPESVTVTPAGDLTRGSGLSDFIGNMASGPSSTEHIVVQAFAMDAQLYVLNLNGDLFASGIGHWTRSISLGAAPVPEPASLATLGIGLATIAGVAWRRVA